MSNSVWNIRLGDGDVQIPIVGMGTYKATGDEVKQAVNDALKIGYRHFDTADYYDVCFFFIFKSEFN